MLGTSHLGVVTIISLSVATLQNYFLYSVTFPTTNTSSTTVRLRITNRDYTQELNDTQSVQYRELVTELTSAVSLQYFTQSLLNISQALVHMFLSNEY